MMILIQNFIIIRSITSFVNKHCWEILQETLLNSVSNDSLPLMVGQSHESFALLSAKNVMFFSALSAGH
jgi:hypothetical protein